MDLYKLLYSKSVLSSHVSLMDWFSKCVKTCPAVVGKTVRWDLHCYECDKVLIQQIENWGSMDAKRYEDVICLMCHMKHLNEINKQFNETEQYEI